MDKIAREIGNNLKKFRHIKGYTQEELAEGLMVSVGYISQLENGFKIPSIPLIAKISEVLDLTGAIMLSNDDELSPELKELIQILINKDPEDILFIKDFAVFYFDKKYSS